MDARPASDKPKVLIPAPFYMGSFVLLGVGLNAWHPLVLIISEAQFYLGWLLIALATGLLISCFALFIKHRTTIMPRNSVNKLVVVGPYRHSRNPMYVSLGLFHLGIAVATGNVWNLLSFPPAMLAIYFWVIAPEEDYMRKTFDKVYLDYCNRVPRWL